MDMITTIEVISMVSIKTLISWVSLVKELRHASKTLRAGLGAIFYSSKLGAVFEHIFMTVTNIIDRYFDTASAAGAGKQSMFIKPLNGGFDLFVAVIAGDQELE